MSAPESLRDAFADLLAEHILDKAIGQCRCGAAMNNQGHRTAEHRDHLADALLASPALARVIREDKAETWDEGWAARADRKHLKHGECVPAPNHINPYRNQTEEPT